MSKVFTWLARFLAGICAFMFGLTLLAALLLVNAEARLFEAATYKNALRGQNLYQRMPKLLAEQIISNLSTNPCQNAPLACLPQQASPLRACLQEKLAPQAFSALSAAERPATAAELATIQTCTAQFGEIPPPIQQQTPGYLKYLTVQDWEVLITALIPPEQIQAVSEQSLDSLFDFVNGKNENPLIVIKPVKQTLAANGAAILNRILAAQPACTPEQIADLSLKLMMGQTVDNNMLCKPPEQLLTLALPLVTGLLDAQIAAIPDAIPMFQKNQFEVRTTLGTVRMLMKLSPLFPLAFLALLTLLAVRSLPGWLKWWGLPLTISGFGALLLSLTAGPVTRLVITYAASQENSFYALRLAATALDAVLAILSQITTRLAIEAILILLIGAGMLAVAWFVTPKRTV